MRLHERCRDALGILFAHGFLRCSVNGSFRLRRRASRLVRIARGAAQLSWREAVLALEITAAILSVVVVLRIAPRRLLSRALVRNDAGPMAETPTDLIQLFDRVARALPLNVNCLPRSLALRRLLHRRGLVTHLVIGARRSNNVLEGHAWLQSGATVIADAPDIAQRFPPMSGTAATMTAWYRGPHTIK